MAADAKEVWDTDQVAAETGISARTYERMRLAGGGPVYCQVGKRVLYLREDVLTWLRSQRVRSTSEVSAGRAKVAA